MRNFSKLIGVSAISLAMCLACSEPNDQDTPGAVTPPKPSVETVETAELPVEVERVAEAELDDATTLATAEIPETVEQPEPAQVVEVVADAVAGKRAFASCIACHSVDKGGRSIAGPNLYGIVGADIAAVEGFRYSKALSEFEGVWTKETLDAYLANPQKLVRGTSMAFTLRNPKQRADVIAYLETLKDE